MTPLQQFKADELDRFKQQHPTLPYPESFFRGKDRYCDTTANGLTKLVIRFLEFHGWQAERINTTGRPIDTTKKVRNVIGQEYRIGSITWIPGTGKRGSADISAIVKGRSWKIEVKMKDKQSVYQKQYQASVERAGGFYSIVHSFDEFYEQYINLINQI